MANKILRFLFGWVYDFDSPKIENNEMTDEEAKYINEHFDESKIRMRFRLI